jgi:hypothetical protein
MTMRDFELMNGIEKMQAIAELGVFLAKRKEGCFSISLYQIEDFYIEIYFHTTQLLYISARTFTNTAELSSYLDQIDISSLFSE